ncbi:hypothetical protein [Streptomyces sp. NPDC050560]|uniref:hypothetical protein n=1 Tax=Streptomyces sp. NPDC050560 TaxID=3365630 RepID=UPI003792DF1C
MALLTLDDAKAQLNLTNTTEAQDAELQAYVDAVGPVIEGYIGPVEPREVTQTVVGRGPTLCLSTTPVLVVTSLTSVYAGWTGIDSAGLHVDGESGVLRRLDGAHFRGGPWTAVYTAGREEEPGTVNLAARMLVQHLWRTQNRASPSVLGGGDDYSVTEPVPGFGYAVPNRVLELLEPYKRPPGVA